jgi:hypothetical protein
VSIGHRIADVVEQIEQPPERPVQFGRRRFLSQFDEYVGEAAALDHLHREE